MCFQSCPEHWAERVELVMTETVQLSYCLGVAYYHSCIGHALKLKVLHGQEFTGMEILYKFINSVWWERHNLKCRDRIGTSLIAHTEVSRCAWELTEEPNRKTALRGTPFFPKNCCHGVKELHSAVDHHIGRPAPGLMTSLRLGTSANYHELYLEAKEDGSQLLNLPGRVYYC